MCAGRPLPREDEADEVAPTLSKGGWLLLGAAETLLNIQCPFERCQAASQVFYRRT
ncbi:MAG: hypothetical protein SGI92_16540 [Bryobacteraceae bacterium]|nr:hypothetical protein [Bryobacteraceae bacterium]